jgi:hypothetical protein
MTHKKYYGQIVMLFALTVGHVHGVPLSACKLRAKGLLSAKYSIKTGFGISNGTYSLSNDQPNLLMYQAKEAAGGKPLLSECNRCIELDPRVH